MKLKKIPYKDIYQLRQKFIDKYKSLPDDQKESQKEIIQAEFNSAVSEHEEDISKQQKEIKQENLKSFLDDPKGILQEINETRGRSFSIGEQLISYGIATTTIKRFGKGELVHKGTLAEHIRSNFKITAKIGTHTLTEELAGSNDKRDKDSSMAMIASRLAGMIVDGKM